MEKSSREGHFLRVTHTQDTSSSREGVYERVSPVAAVPNERRRVRGLAPGARDGRRRSANAQLRRARRDTLLVGPPRLVARELFERALSREPASLQKRLSSPKALKTTRSRRASRRTF